MSSKIHFMQAMFLVLLLAGAGFAEITLTRPAGNGTKDSPFQITSAAELYWLAATVNNVECGNYASGGNCSAVLMNNITLNENLLGTNNANVNAEGTFDGHGSAFESWTPIGTQDFPYVGTFNGNNNMVNGVLFFL